MEIACDNIDRVMNVEMRRPGLPRGNKWAMYSIARNAAPAPLVLETARMFDRAPARVLIVSGAAVPKHMPLGENDGPIGSAVLAKSLSAIGHSVAILTDPACAGPFEGLIRYLDISVEVFQIGLEDRPMQERMVEANDLFIAIERLGGNVNGNLYGVNGNPRGGMRANLDHLFRTARALGKPTMAIGDGGNEIGFGKIRDRLEREMPEYAYKDVTPCGGGIYSAMETDTLLVANSSNIGAYGVTAALALLRQDPSLCHTPELDYALAHVGAGLGLVDGVNGELRPWCDGIPPEANAAVVQVMLNIVERTLETAAPRHF
jgi:D-glutamate cyclase